MWKKRFFKRVKSEKGAIIVEASISLPIFMFAIFTILSIINISIAQAKIGVAINSTAREISQYSYIYGLTGLNKKEQELHQAGHASTDKVGQIVDGVATIGNSMQEFQGAFKNGSGDIMGTVGTLQSSAQEAYESGKMTAATAKEIAEDPATFFMGLAKAAASEGLEFAKSNLIAEPLAKGLVQKHLVNDSFDNCEDYLKHLGIVEGTNGKYLDGIDFSDSVIFMYGTDEIKIIAKYQVQVIKLLGLDIKMNFTQCATTKAWFTGVSTGKPPAQGGSGGGSAGGAVEPPLEIGVGGPLDENQGIVAGGGEDSEDGEDPTSTPEAIELKSPGEYALLNTHNPFASTVMLGKTRADAMVNGYVKNAEEKGMTYYAMPDPDWDAIKAEYDRQGKDGEREMWEINKAFMDQQVAAGKSFATMHTHSDYNEGYFADELAYLRRLTAEKKYYEEKVDDIIYWHPVK